MKLVEQLPINNFLAGSFDAIEYFLAKLFAIEIRACGCAGYRGTGNPQFFLGGVGRLTAYGLNELLGDQYFVGRVGYLHQIAMLPTFVGKSVYLVGYGEVGKMYEDPFGAPRLSGDGTAGVIANTFLGPVFVGGAVGDTGHRKWFFQLGRVF